MIITLKREKRFRLNCRERKSYKEYWAKMSLESIAYLNEDRACLAI